MQNILLFFLLTAVSWADFHNKLYSDICYTFVHNRRDLQPQGEKAAQIRAEIVNRAYVTSSVIKWEREDEYTFPVLAMIEDEAIEQACKKSLEIEKSSDPEHFIFYMTYQKELYKQTVQLLMHKAKPKQKAQ